MHVADTYALHWYARKIRFATIAISLGIYTTHRIQIGGAPRLLWAHSGFAQPDEVGAMLAKHKRLWSDLAFRTEHASDGKVDAEWRKLFEKFPNRFMVGTDTFAPERWHFVVEHAKWSRGWLKSLPAALADRIAYKNAEALAAWAMQKKP